eukprot:516524_1
MSEFSYRFICGTAVVFTVISVCASVYILLSWKKLKKMKQSDILNDYVAYMSVFDIVNLSQRAVYLSNPTFKWQFMSQASNKFCKILGGLLQFTGMCEITWNFIIAAFILLPIIIGQPMYKVVNRKILHFMFILVVTCITTLLPALNDGYGFTDNNDSHYGFSKYECWIENSNDFISLYAVYTFYILFSIILLVWSVLCRFSGDRSLALLRSQLIWYTVVFVCGGAPQIMNRIYAYFTDENSIALLYLGTISFSFIGFANALIWYHYMKPVDSDIDAHANSQDLLANEMIQ